MHSLPRRARGAALVAFLGIVLGLAGCGQGNSKTAAAPSPPQVTVARPVMKTVVDQDEYVGRFVAVDAIEVRARVSGYLDSVHFKDGQMVKKGDLLFTIDRRPFQNALDQSRASLAQARANLAYAEADLVRAQNLIGGRVISEQTLEQRTQAKRVAEANVSAQEAALRQAALDLEFTELRAPVAGRIGDRRVSPGNLVTGGTTGTTTLLATIQSTDPMRFEFTLDEASYLRYLRLAKIAPDLANDGGEMPVRLKLLDEKTFTHAGRMDFVDNAIDRSTGTIRGRAVLPNPDGTFTPGMFARIQVAAGPAEEALLLPDVAVGTEQVRKYVLVVDEEDVTRTKYVTLGPMVDGLRVIASGIGAEDRVIVNGLMRTRPGMKVTPQMSTAAAADTGGARSN
ncbi:MAG: efflux RND transporter periplasmic adaptor subunit [Hyphomicrobiaceae bacterium]